MEYRASAGYATHFSWNMLSFFQSDGWLDGWLDDRLVSIYLI